MLKQTITWGFVEDKEYPDEPGFYDCVTDEVFERMHLYYSREENRFFLDSNKLTEIPVYRWVRETEEEEL